MKVLTLMLALNLIFFLNSKTVLAEEKWLELTHKADALTEKGDYEEAYKAQKMAVRKSKSIFFNKKNTSLAFAISRLGGICLVEKKYDEAISCYSKSSEIYLTTFGLDYDPLATAYCALGTTYHAMGKLLEAEIFFNKAIPIYARNHGACFDSIIAAQLVLSQIYLEAKKYELAEEICNKSLKCLSSVEIGITNQAYAYSQLGLINYSQNKFKLARRFYEKAKNLYQKDPDATLQTRINNLGSLAFAYFMEKNYLASKRCNGEILELTKSNLGDYSWDRAGAFLSLAQNEMFLKNKLRSEEYLDKALSEYANAKSATVEERKKFLEPCVNAYNWLGKKRKKEFVQQMFKDLLP